MSTKGDCKTLFLRYLDEATKKGIDLPESKNADYRDKFNYFLDPACKYIAGIIKIPASYQVTQNPIDNLIGNSFELKQYKPDLTDQEKTITITGAKSYYIEIDNVGTVTIAVNGSTDTTISNTTKGSFTVYKGNITAESTDIVTVTFSGNYVFNYRYLALFAYNFPLDTDVPNYTPYTTYDMPADFMTFDSITIKSNPELYAAYTQYKWENTKKVILNYFDSGSFNINYFRYPATIAQDAADTTEIDAEDNAVELIVLQTAIRATAADNASLSAYLRNLFVEQVQNVPNENKILENSVQTLYYMG